MTSLITELPSMTARSEPSPPKLDTVAVSCCATLVDLQDFLALPLASMCSSVKMNYFAVYERSRFQEKY